MFGLFSDLPAIFAGNVTEDGLQVEQRLLADFGARKMGSQPLMYLAQAQSPGANRTQAWPSWLGCAMLVLLHVFLVSDGQLAQEVLVLLACHIGA